MIQIDGNYLEGGGQIVRTAVALSVITSQPIEVINIRKGRDKPGLKNQHLHAITALKELCNAEVEGLELGSQKLIFKPGQLNSKTINIDVGTAGSIGLVLQALLFPCFFADKQITLRIRGGTCVKWAMPIEFLENVLLPQIEVLCASIKLQQEKRGYYPAGGGKVTLKIKPPFNKKIVFDKTVQGKLVCIKGTSHASKDLEKAQVSERQAKSAKELLKKYNIPINISTEYSDSLSTGSGITLWVIFEKENGDRGVILGSDALGEKRKTSEIVGKEAAQGLIKEIDSGACVDKYTCDNLIPFMAFLPGSKIKTSEITEHTLTNIYTVEQFFGKIFEVEGDIVRRV
ncbi:RNA 3'-terminal phosphate cyclase [Candidatus Woesearchaeota archaeon]|nr:RNA 3'-terminal phosphate cyclase [Candidatus Woesearchaeota archaeon]